MSVKIARSGRSPPVQPPGPTAAGGVDGIDDVVDAGVPDSVGASTGVAGALTGSPEDLVCDNADIDVHCGQSIVQSQMSPSA